MSQGHERYDDHQAHERALRVLANQFGADRCGDVSWDPDHHLQGHVDVDDEHLVLIAPRDEEHRPLVLTESEWDALRRGAMAAA
jgi:hypothetical protein